MGMTGVSAQEEVHATFASPQGTPNTTWDAGSKTFGWTAPSYNQLKNIGLPSGDITGYEKLVIDCTIADGNKFRILVYKGSENKTIWVNSSGKTEFVLADVIGDVSFLTNCTEICLSGPNWEGVAPGSAVINDFYLVKAAPSDQIKATKVFDAPGTKDLNDLTGTNTNWSVVTPAIVTGEAKVFCGDGDGSAEATHVTITGSDFIQFHVTNASSDANQSLRVWIWDDKNSKVVTLYAHPVEEYASVSNWETPASIKKDGDYVVKVSEYNYFKGVKSNWGSGGSITISKAYVSQGGVPIPCSEKYVLTGETEGNPSLTAALADASATLIDATGVTGTGLNLVSANPNCVFVANAGTLSNAQNVSVGGTIANLVITDGHPFTAPAGSSATTATYARDMTNQFGTICLPYAISSTEAMKFYTIAGLSGDVLTLKAETSLAAGTPAIVEKVSGSSISVSGSGTLANAIAGTSNLELIGTFEPKVISASNYSGKNIYAISNNQFVKANNTINLPAFRAFFTADAEAGAKIRIVADDEDMATAIDALAGVGNVVVESIHALNGAKIPSLQKGINIVKFSNGSVKKILVK